MIFVCVEKIYFFSSESSSLEFSSLESSSSEFFFVWIFSRISSSDLSLPESEISAFFTDGELLQNLSLSIYHPKRISDWDWGREAGRMGCGQARKWEFCYVWQSLCLIFGTALPPFWRYRKFATNWYATWPSMETFIFLPLARPLGSMLPWGWVFQGLSTCFLYFSESM